jgi:hypothetical protein
MNDKLPLIRIATYCVFAAILCMRPKEVRVIPVSITSGDDVDAMREAHRRAEERIGEDRNTVNTSGFTETKRSGSEVLAIGSAAAVKYGAKLGDFGRPRIEVKKIDGRLKWQLLYIRDYGPGLSVAPAETFLVTIDDATGEREVKNATASY